MEEREEDSSKEQKSSSAEKECEQSVLPCDAFAIDDERSRRSGVRKRRDDQSEDEHRNGTTKCIYEKYETSN